MTTAQEPQKSAAPPAPQHLIAWDTRPTSVAAVVSLVFSLAWIFGLGSLLAIVLGAVARGDTQSGKSKGDAFAIAGITIGLLGLISTVLFFAMLFLSGGSFFGIGDDPTPSIYSPSYGSYGSYGG